MKKRWSINNDKKRASRFQECSWGRFQKEANKQLCSSWFTLAVIVKGEEKEIRNRKIIWMPESTVWRWHPGLVCGAIEMAFSHNFLLKLGLFHYVFHRGDNQIQLHFETHLFQNNWRFYPSKKTNLPSLLGSAHKSPHLNQISSTSNVHLWSGRHISPLMESDTAEWCRQKCSSKWNGAM